MVSTDQAISDSSQDRINAQMEVIQHIYGRLACREQKHFGERKEGNDAGNESVDASGCIGLCVSGFPCRIWESLALLVFLDWWDIGFMKKDLSISCRMDQEKAGNRIKYLVSCFYTSGERA